LFSAALCFSQPARASETVPVTPVYFVTDAPGPGPGFYAGFFERFTRFQDIGWLSLTSVLYTFHNEGSEGYRSINNLSPGFKPGFYLKESGDGSLSGQLSLWSWDKGVYKKDGQGPGGDRRFSFFAGPQIKDAYERMKRAIGMPVIDDANSRQVPECLIGCGFMWRFR
jgi:hypothetical protein